MWEIEIYGLTDDTQMNEIAENLFIYGIPGEDVDDIGVYLQDNKPRSVFVEPQSVTKAVGLINALGYETDEDGRIA